MNAAVVKNPWWFGEYPGKWKIIIDGKCWFFSDDENWCIKMVEYINHNVIPDKLFIIR